MNEKQLVEDFKRVEVEYERVFKAVHDFFLPLANAAYEAKDMERLQDLVRRCPEHVAKCFILDQIRQLRRDLENGG
jgi:hypothetical protein